MCNKVQGSIVISPVMHYNHHACGQIVDKEELAALAAVGLAVSGSSGMYFAVK